MVSRITRILLVLQLLIVIAIVALSVYAWRVDKLVPALLLGVGLILLVRLLITANNFFITWRYRSETPDSLRIGRRDACRLFFGEFRATMLSSSWTMAFHHFTK